MAGMNSICCILCKKMSKEHVKLDRFLEHGEEKMQQYINAEFVFETLQKHQNILKQLKPDQVDDKVYNDIINVSDDDELKVITLAEM